MRLKPLLLHAERRDLLYPESRSKRRLPSNFQTSDLNLFEHELEKTIPATDLLKFGGCRVAGNGVLFRGLHVCEESFSSEYALSQWASPKSMLRFFAANNVFNKVQRCAEEVVLFTDAWSGAYFHWITDALPRLYALGARVKGATILLPMPYGQFEYTAPSLAPFEIGTIRHLDKQHVLLCRDVIVPTHTAPSGNYNAVIMNGLKDRLLAHFGARNATPNGERVYVSRQKAKVRRIANEEDVEVVLKQSGFRTVCFEDCTFAQQVAIASNASCMVSNHGAGLTNMLFMPAGGRVLELRKAGDSHNNCYFALASAVGLEYWYQLCDAQTPDEDAYSADLVVDTEKLKKNIDLMCGR